MLKDLKEVLTEDKLYAMMHKAIKVVFDDTEWHTIICATEDQVFLEEDSTGDEIELSYAELLEEVSAVNYNVKFYELKEIEL